MEYNNNRKGYNNRNNNKIKKVDKNIDDNRNGNNNQDDNDKFKKVDEIIKDIKKGGKLSGTLKIKDLNLPNQAAYIIGEAFSKGDTDKDKLNTNQLRKYFDQIKAAELIDNFKEAKDNLFKILPHVAYAAGRNVCPRKFYYLLEACISDESLKDKKDIETLVNFMSSIVAYSKFVGGK